MDYSEASLSLKGEAFPYILFGSGKKNPVMLAGMPMTGLSGHAEPVSEMYRDCAEACAVCSV